MSSIGNLQMSVGKLQLPSLLLFTHDTAVGMSELMCLSVCVAGMYIVIVLIAVAVVVIVCVPF